ncbi:MAG TPA: hypothetical protein VGJ77_16810 [Gaiellaceae bacterium]
MTPLRLATATLVLAAAGCGVQSASAPGPPAPPLRAERAPASPPSGPIAADAGASVAVRAGAGGALCVVASARGARRADCLRAWDHAPVVLRLVVGGANHKREDWMAVVGLARAPVARVVLDPDYMSRRLPLRPARGLRWRAFAAMTGRHDRPNMFVAYDARGKKLWEIELSWSYNPPCMPKNDDICADHPPPGAWAEVRDPVLDQSGAPQPETMKRIVFAHPAVRRLVAGRQFFLDPLFGWQKCNGENIGGGVSIWFPYAVSFDGTIPVEETRDDAKVAYFTGRAHARASHVRAVDVWVDIRARKVVGIDLSGIAQESADGDVEQADVDLDVIGELRPAGGPDVECPQTD